MVDPLALLDALALQAGPNVDVTVDPVANVLGGALGAAVSTLVVGAILVTLAPDYVERTMDVVVDEPVGSLLWGVFILLAVFVLSVALVITVVGVLLAIPLLLVTWVAWAAGSAVAFLAVADRLVGHEDGWLKPLAVAAAANGLLAVTGIGGLVSFVVGAAGFGAVVRDYLE
jgi:hypothetical protein